MSSDSANSDPAAVESRRFDEVSARELHDILRLRSEVFVVEQECIYLDVDGRDVEPGTVHYWIERTGEIVAYLRALSDDDGGVRIGRVVTAPSARGNGLAARLVTSVASGVRGTLVLDAQTYLTEWYEQLGFAIDGDEFVEDGIPHVPMRRVDSVS